MKRSFKLFIIGSFCLLSLSSVAQNTRPASDTTVKYYSGLANSDDPADKELLEKLLYERLKKDTEYDWIIAARLFGFMRKPLVRDSILNIVRTKYPMGETVRKDEVQKVYSEKDPEKKEEAYKAWIKKFPPSKFGPDHMEYDYARNSVSTSYAVAKNVKKAIEYADMIETPSWKGEGWAATAERLAARGYEKEAIELYKKAIAHSQKMIAGNNSDNPSRAQAPGYAGFANALAKVLYRLERYKEALPYIRMAHDNNFGVRADINGTYANVLLELGKPEEAFKIIDEAVKAGVGNKEMKDLLQDLYVKVKGSNEGYDEYIASLNKSLIKQVRANLARDIMNKPAPDFTLKDLDGNTVSLSDLKGKTVILDFWATWCAPCKRSFPSMQMAIDKYKNDPNVKFLFIHTWEKESEPTKLAKKYIDDKKFSFEVLMDLKDLSTGRNPVVDSYKVTGIPAKFVIDKKGNIRFSLNGFAGGEDLAVEEITAMIEMCQK